MKTCSLLRLSRFVFFDRVKANLPEHVAILPGNPPAFSSGSLPDFTPFENRTIKYPSRLWRDGGRVAT